MQIEMIKIGAAGEQLPKDAPEWDAVLLPQFGIMLGATNVLPEKATQRELEEASKKLTLCGRNDWLLVDVDEMAPIIRRDRCDPAIDTDFFRDIHNGRYWTRTQPVWDEDAAAGSSAFAWSVRLGSGNVGNGNRLNRGFGLPVCRVGQ